MDQQESWKPIPGFTGYEVSNLGRVRSYRTNKTECGYKGWHISSKPQRILRQTISGGNYELVCMIGNDGKKHTKRIASLVLLAFVGPPSPDLEICHNNDIKTDNRLCNLRYDTHLNNMRDSYINKRSSKLSHGHVRKIRERYAGGENARVIATDFNICAKTVHDIGSGRTHKYAPGPIAPRA